MIFRLMPILLLLALALTQEFLLHEAQAGLRHAYTVMDDLRAADARLQRADDELQKQARRLLRVCTVSEGQI